MAFKKPSEYFKRKDDIVSIDEKVQEITSSKELTTFSDAFDSFKKNLSKIEVLSDFSETFENYKLNIEKVQILSEQISSIKEEIQNALKKEDLDRAMLSQLLVVEESIVEIQNKVKTINETKLFEIREEVQELTEVVDNFIEVEAPKYKKLIVENEINIESKFNQLQESVSLVFENVDGFIDEKLNELNESLSQTNKEFVDEVTLQLEKLGAQVQNVVENDIPTYKNFIVEIEKNSDSKVQKKLKEFDENLEKKIELISEKLNEFNSRIQDNDEKCDSVFEQFKESINQVKLIGESIETDAGFQKRLNKRVSDLEVQIIRNESHLKVQNSNLEKIQEDIKSSFDNLNLDDLEKQNYELGKKVKFLEEVFEKFNEKEILTEDLVSESNFTEPPSTDTQDPLTPLDKNFVTFEQLQQHYRLYINRIQQQLSTLGGGGETRLKYLDDIVGIATNPSAYDGKYLKYDHSQGKFEFTSITQGGNIDTDNIVTNSITILDSDSSTQYSGNEVSSQKAFIAITQSANPISIHKKISALEYSTVEYLIQATLDLRVDSRRIITVNDKININKKEIESVSIGSTFVDYVLNIEDGYVNLVATATTSSKIVYNILYTAISRPLLEFNITDESNNLIITEDNNMLVAEDY